MVRANACGMQEIHYYTTYAVVATSQAWEGKRDAENPHETRLWLIMYHIRRCGCVSGNDGCAVCNGASDSLVCAAKYVNSSSCQLARPALLEGMRSLIHTCDAQKFIVLPP